MPEFSNSKRILLLDEVKDLHLNWRGSAALDRSPQSRVGTINDFKAAHYSAPPRPRSGQEI
jgi:hypothetical protein